MQLSSRRFKLFNAGDRIQQTLRYSNPNGHDTHCICLYSLDAPAGKLFTVPEMIDVQGAVVHVHFVDDIIRDFGTRGVILIDAAFDPPLRYAEDGQPTDEIDAEAWAAIPVARTEEEAKTKGQAAWKVYIDVVVRAYLDQCEQIRAAGGVPIAASGWTKRALLLAGMVDPAEAMLIESKRQTSAIDKLQETIAAQAEQNKAQQKQIDLLLQCDQTREAERSTNKPAKEPELAGAAKGK